MQIEVPLETCFCQRTREEAHLLVLALAAMPPRVAKDLVRKHPGLVRCPRGRLELSLRVLAHRRGLTPSIPPFESILH